MRLLESPLVDPQESLRTQIDIFGKIVMTFDSVWPGIFSPPGLGSPKDRQHNMASFRIQLIKARISNVGVNCVEKMGT